METSLPLTQTNQQPIETPVITSENNNEEKSVNLYPIVRHLFLIVCVLLTVSIILFLLYQNGRSLYDKGI